MPQSRVRIFRDKPTRSTLLVPKLMFWCVSYRLGVFATIWMPYETRGKTFRTRAQVRATNSRRNFRNESTQSTPWDPKLMFWCISYHLGPLGCLMKLRAKWAKLVQRCVPQSRVGIFRNESTRSTPWDHKLMFWSILYHLDAFVTVRLPYETRWKTGRTSARVRATKSNWNFSRRTHPIHPI